MATEEEKQAAREELNAACPPGFRISTEAFVINDETGVQSHVTISGRILPKNLTPEYFKGLGEKACEALEVATDSKGFRLMTDAEVKDYRREDKPDSIYVDDDEHESD